MDLFSTIEHPFIPIKARFVETEFESGEKGWFGQYDNFIVPAQPNQSKEYVERKIEEYKNGLLNYFKM